MKLISLDFQLTTHVLKLRLTTFSVVLRQLLPIGEYLVLLIVSVCGDVFFCTDGVSVKLLTQQAEKSSDRQQEL